MSTYMSEDNNINDIYPSGNYQPTHTHTSIGMNLANKLSNVIEKISTQYSIDYLNGIDLTHHDKYILINFLEHLYIFTQSDEIRDYILSNEFLIPLLLEAFEKIYEIFGEVPLYLELHRDPEGWDELFIVIKTSGTPEQLIALENKLIDEWFIHILDDTKGKLNIIGELL